MIWNGKPDHSYLNGRLWAECCTKKDLCTLRSVVENFSRVQDDLRNTLKFALFLFVSIFLCYFWKERNKNFQIYFFFYFFFSSEIKYDHVTVPCLGDTFLVSMLLKMRSTCVVLNRMWDRHIFFIADSNSEILNLLRICQIKWKITVIRDLLKHGSLIQYNIITHFFK